MDVRGQIIRNRNEHLTQLFESLEADYVAGRYKAIILNYRTFMIHAANTELIGQIPDNKILAGQETHPGSDQEKINNCFGEEDELLHALSRTVHAAGPCPEQDQEMATLLMGAARKWKARIDMLDKGLNRWYDEQVAAGITPGRYHVKRQNRGRNRS